MGVNPKRGTGQSIRPLLQRDIETAQRACKSAAECARYLHVSYTTYKKYATAYGLWKVNKGGVGISRQKFKGVYGLQEILAGNHPNYDKTKLRDRIIAAGYLKEECGMCGFNERRISDGKIPLVLNCMDGDLKNLKLENLQLLCYNHTFLTSGPITKHSFSSGVHDADMEEAGLTEEDILKMQEEALAELEQNGESTHDENS
jgi:hypothetical protein